MTRPPTLLARLARPEATALEQVAAEFALLAQRRARAARQIDLLSRQLDAAERGHAAVERRLTQLAQRMTAMAPDVLVPAQIAPPAPPPPPPVPPTPSFAPRVARHAAGRMAPGRKRYS